MASTAKWTTETYGEKKEFASGTNPQPLCIFKVALALFNLGLRVVLAALHDDPGFGLRKKVDAFKIVAPDAWRKNAAYFLKPEDLLNEDGSGPFMISYARREGLEYHRCVDGSPGRYLVRANEKEPDMTIAEYKKLASQSKALTESIFPWELTEDNLRTHDPFALIEMHHRKLVNKRQKTPAYAADQDASLFRKAAPGINLLNVNDQTFWNQLNEAGSVGAEGVTSPYLYFVGQMDENGNESEDEVLATDERAPRSKKKTYTIEKKLEIVEYAKLHGNHAAAKLGYDRSNVKKRRKKENDYRAQLAASLKKDAKKNIKGAGRPPTDPEVDLALANWIRQQREAKLLITRRMVQNEGRRLWSLRAHDDKELKFSDGWLELFFARHNMVLRQKTSVAQKPPAEYADALVNFVMYIDNLRKEKNFTRIYACDETAVWLNASHGRTVDERGARTVTVRGFGSEKVRVTVMLTARSDGHKEKPFVLIDRVRPVREIQQLFGQDLELVWAGRSWMNNDLTATYLKTYFVSYGSPFSAHRALLVWDSFRCHISDDTKKLLRKYKLSSAVVPGGCTGFVQAYFAQMYEDWVLQGDYPTTSGGNPKPPPMERYLEWIVEAWNKVTQEIIIDSFKVCGITVAPDGSEDSAIGCFKDYGAVPNGRELLLQRRMQNAVNELLEEIDLDQDLENGFEDPDDILVLAADE